MKVEVNNKGKIPQIDWYKAQLVISDNNEIVQVSIKQKDRYDEDCFCGQEIQKGDYANDWIKKRFTLFNGTITIKND